MIRPSRRLRASTFGGAVTWMVAVAILVTACSSPGTSATSASPAAPGPTSQVAAATTVTREFTPYTADGQLAIAVATHLSGSCWTTSIALPSAHTYRCLADNQILDPCFAPAAVAKPTSVACFTDPWTSGVELTLSQPLPAADAGTRSMPWAVQLVDGTRCVALTGTVDQVGDLDLEYGCGSTGEAGLVPSAPSSATLQVEYRASDAQPLHQVAVATAWRG